MSPAMDFFHRKAASPAVGCYGKLPTAADFVSHGAEGRDVAPFLDWLQGAAPGLRGREPSETQVLRFLWPDPAGRGALVGVLWPSRDLAGRRFPFTTFQRLPQETVASAGGFLPLVVEPLWRHLLDLGVRIRDAAPGPAQFAAVAAAPPPPDPATRSAAEAELMAGGAACLDDAHALGRVALSMAEFLRYCAALRQEDPLPPYALRLRLTSPADLAAEATCWLRVMEERVGRGLPTQAIFLRVDPADVPRGRGAAAYLFAREMAPGDLPFLLAPVDRYPHADSIGFREVPPDAADAATRDRLLDRRRGMPSTWATLVHLGVDDGAGDDAWRASGASSAARSAPVPATVVTADPAGAGPDDPDTGDLSGEVTCAIPPVSAVPVRPAPPGPTVGAVAGRFWSQGAGATAVPEPPAPAVPALEEDRAAAFWSAAPTEVPAAPRARRAAPPSPVDDEPATGDDPGDPGETMARVRELLDRPLLAGEVLEARAPDGGGSVHVLVLRAGASSRAVLLSERVDVADARAAAANHAAARALLDLLARAHRRIEESLERELEQRAAAHRGHYVEDDAAGG